MKKFYTLFFVLTVLICTINAATIYVSSVGTGGGTSWTDTKDLAAAITAATSSDEIWVKAGTYNATATILSLVSKKIYGGFAGTESVKTERVKSDMDGNGLTEPWEFTNESKIDGGGLYRVF